MRTKQLSWDIIHEEIGSELGEFKNIFYNSMANDVYLIREGDRGESSLAGGESQSHLR